MATSSIIENIRVNNPKLLEEFVEATYRFLLGTAEFQAFWKTNQYK